MNLTQEAVNFRLCCVLGVAHKFYRQVDKIIDDIKSIVKSDSKLFNNGILRVSRHIVSVTFHLVIVIFPSWFEGITYPEWKWQEMSLHRSVWLMFGEFWRLALFTIECCNVSLWIKCIYSGNVFIWVDITENLVFLLKQTSTVWLRIFITSWKLRLFLWYYLRCCIVNSFSEI